ncbi:hypothetical protein M9458_044674, partial [Cirrhinus mrigala]
MHFRRATKRRQVDDVVMGPHNNLLNGVAATFSAYYVFNLQYPKEASSTLEFVQ